MSQVILITGASSGLGLLMAKALAKSGYASMRDTNGRNAKVVTEINDLKMKLGQSILPIEIDVLSQSSIDNAIQHIFTQQKCLDVFIHNGGHMGFGPAEAFTPEQFAHMYDVNALSTQRPNRAVLPHMCQEKKGLLVWISSSSSAGGTLPYLAAKRDCNKNCVTAYL